MGREQMEPDGDDGLQRNPNLDEDEYNHLFIFL